MNSPKAFFSGKLFLHDIKRYKALLIIFGILLFLAGPFAEIFAISMSGEALPLKIELRSHHYDLVNTVIIAVAVFSFFAGALTALVVSNRYSKKKSAFFYSSLPIKKSTSYITDTVCGISIYAICLLADAVIAYLVLMATTEGIAAFLFSAFTKIFIQGICYFIVGYGFFSFASQICASTVCAAVFGNLLIFIGTLTSAILISSGDLFDTTGTYDFQYYFGKTAKLSPLFILGYGYNPDAGEKLLYTDGLLIWTLIGLALTVASFFIFVYRKTESAGETVSVIWGRYLIRALCIIPSSAGFALAFYTISERNPFWSIIGFSIGAVLAHMVINGIIFKNTKKLFYGIISFAVICTVSVGLLIGMKCDILGIYSFPDSENVEKIEVTGTFFDKKYITDDREAIDILCEIFKNGSEYSDFYSPYCHVVYYKKNGIPVAKCFHITPDKDEMEKIEYILTEKTDIKQLYDDIYKPFEDIVKSQKAVKSTVCGLSSDASFDGNKFTELFFEDLKAHPFKIGNEVTYCAVSLLYDDLNDLYFMDNEYIVIYPNDNTVTFAVPTCFTKTVDFLKANGVRLEFEDLSKAERIIIKDEEYIKGSEEFEKYLAVLYEKLSKITAVDAVYNNSGIKPVLIFENNDSYTISFID